MTTVISFRLSLTKYTSSKVSINDQLQKFSMLTHQIYWLTKVESWIISSLVAHWLSRFYCRKFPLRQGVSAYKMVCSSLLHRSEACLFCLHGYAQSQTKSSNWHAQTIVYYWMHIAQTTVTPANLMWRHITSLQIWLYKKVLPDFGIFLSGNVYVTICSLLLFL